MEAISLGKRYKDKECVVRQGEEGNCMFVIQKGELEVIEAAADCEVHLGKLKAGDIFGEMALFEKEPRSATVRAIGEAWVLTVDKRTLLRRIKEDPLVALNIIEILCQRIRVMDKRTVNLETSSDHAGEAVSG